LIGPENKSQISNHHFQDPRTWSNGVYDETHRSIRSKTGFVFPPPRTQYGRPLNSWSNNNQLYKSDYFGGLGNYWSTSMFPFHSDNFLDWPINYDDLKPYYKEIADEIGIAGRKNSLNNYFPENFINNEPIESTPIVSSFMDSINTNNGNKYKLIKGSNHLAVETNPNRINACIYCGGCFYGCHQDSLFVPTRHLKELINKGEIKYIDSIVHKVEKASSGKILINSKEEFLGEYDKVFLCAGAIASTKIVLRSFNLHDKTVYIDDNEMYNFPIFYYGQKLKQFSDHFPISTDVIGFVPNVDDVKYAQSHFTVLPSYLFDFYFPKKLTNQFDSSIKKIQGRFMLAQLYIDGSTASRYAVSINSNDEFIIENVRRDASDYGAKECINTLKNNLSKSSFYIPPFPLMKVRSSAHYVGGFSFINDLIPIDDRCELIPNFYSCDSMVFPESPAQPLTFTIMANAARVTELALNNI
jgi:hypothetical protein